MKIETKKIDETLVQKARHKDVKAFEELINRYNKQTFSLACSILGNEDDAQDVVQESFIKVFQNIRSFRATSSFSTWLYRIVVNQAYTVLKKKKARLHYFSQTEEYENTASSRYENKHRQEMIAATLEEIKPNEKMLLQLFYLEEKSMKEISYITHFSEAKIKVTLHRARQSMNKILQKRLGPNYKELL